MKKIILLAVIAFGITITSCRKERVCECKTTTTEVRTGFEPATTVTNTSDKITTEKQKKTEFKYATSCFSEGSTYNETHGNGPGAYSIAGTIEKSCDLK